VRKRLLQNLHFEEYEHLGRENTYKM
jgi:hypothetical protein